MIKCVICGEELKELDISSSEVLTSKNYDNGGVAKIAFNYGSIHDADIYFIPFCDRCITALAQANKLIYIGNYLTGDKNVD